MFYYRPNNQYINEGSPFEIDGTQYPANWLNLSSPEEKMNLGLEEVITTNSRADERYYWVSEELTEATLTYINIPKDLEMVRNNAISLVNTSAYSLLFPSDWMVVRATEKQTSVPEEWVTYRENVRSAANIAKNQYIAANTVEEIVNVVIEWPVSPDQTIPVA